MEQAKLCFFSKITPCHVNKGALQKLGAIDYLRHRSPNSPDLSPIETIWSIVQSLPEGKVIKNLEDLKKNILFIWNRIPTQYCKIICEKFLFYIKIVNRTGQGFNKRRSNKKTKFIMNKNLKYKDIIEQIVHNENSLSQIKKKKLKELKIKIKLGKKFCGRLILVLLEIFPISVKKYNILIKSIISNEK